MQSLYLVPELAPLAMAIELLRTRLEVIRSDEAGYTTETIIVTGLLAAATIAVIAIIVAKLTTTATNVKTQ